MCGSAVVVAEQDGGLVGERADDSDLRPQVFSGSMPSFLSSTMDSLASLTRKLAVRGAVELALVDFRVRHHAGGSNMPSRMRAVNSRMSAVSMSLSVR